MKRILLLLSVLLLLTGCSREQAPAAAENAPSVPTAAAAPEAAEPEPDQTPEPMEPDAAPESVPETRSPDAAFLWNNTAIAKDGTVVLQLPEHTLQFIRDQITGKPRWILAADSEGRYDSIYALNGAPAEIEPALFDTSGILQWTAHNGDYTVKRLPGGETALGHLDAVYPVGNRIALVPSYKLGSIVFMDPQTGEETARLENGFSLADITFPWSGSGYLPVRSPDGEKVNLVDSNGTPLLNDFVSDIYDVCFSYAIVQTEADDPALHVVELSTQQEVYRSSSTFILLPDAALVCQGGRQWQLQDWQGQPLFEQNFTDQPIIYEEDGVPLYLVGQVLRGTSFIPVILRPDGTVLGELPADLSEIGLVSSTAITYSLSVGEQAEAHLYLLETGEDILLTWGNEIVLSGTLEQGAHPGRQVRSIETSGGHMFVITVDQQLLLFLNDGTPGRQDLGPAVYLGDDVFSTEDGLRCLDGSWLYRP